jgi:tetratricopeptide (TPR) repeat protein
VIIIRTWTLFIAVLLAHGCAAPGDKQEGSAGAEGGQALVVYTTKDGLTASARFSEVLVLLEEGRPAPARLELLEYLEVKPGSAIAQDILAQIDMPPGEYFPEDYHVIELKSGQSLSTLSKTYLGSIYQFHALAKYNGIAQPGKIKVGQEIRIPLTVSARETLRAQAMASEIVPAAANVIPLEQGPELESEEQQVAQPASSQDLETVVPSSIEPVVSVQQKADQADVLHREALNAYRAQDLDKAIALWDQLLELEPDYESASIYRSQAVELRNKLTKLN